MARPVRLRPECERRFGMRKSHLSAILKTFGNALYMVSQQYLLDPRIWHRNMAYYGSLVAPKCDFLFDNNWGFIDGTIRRTCRPIMYQHLLYTRYKRCHGTMHACTEKVASSKCSKRSCQQTNPMDQCMLYMAILHIHNGFGYLVALLTLTCLLQRRRLTTECRLPAFALSGASTVFSVSGLTWIAVNRCCHQLVMTRHNLSNQIVLFLLLLLLQVNPLLFNL